MQLGRFARLGLVSAWRRSVVAPTAWQSQQQLVATPEDALADAGFVDHPANTPERQVILHRLPPHQFVQRVNDEGAWDWNAWGPWGPGVAPYDFVHGPLIGE
jgi:hypothetical protein